MFWVDISIQLEDFVKIKETLLSLGIQIKSVKLNII